MPLLINCYFSFSLTARITVQFQSVVDKFSPHDTVFPLSASSELTESALSSACLLHAASSSMTSSSSSLRRRRLGEITEDAEEAGPSREESQHRQQQQPPQVERSRDRRRESLLSRTSEATAVPESTNHRDSDMVSITESTRRASRDFSVSEKSTRESDLSRPVNGSSINDSLRRSHFEPASIESRKSSQSARPSLGELDRTTLYRPKVKLGPRPSLDSSGRPRTAGSVSRSSDDRPVAALPASIRQSSRRSGLQQQPRPKSQPDAPAPTLSAMAPPVPHLLIPTPPLSISGSISRNGPSSPRSVQSVPTSLTATPEKQRLMRALQLRKQQMEKRKGDSDEKNETDISKSAKQAASHSEENKENVGTFNGRSQTDGTAEDPYLDPPSHPTLPHTHPNPHPHPHPHPHPQPMIATRQQHDSSSSLSPQVEKKQRPPSPGAVKSDSATTDVEAIDSASVHNVSQTSSTISVTSPDPTEKLSTPTSPSLAPRRSIESLTKEIGHQDNTKKAESSSTLITGNGDSNQSHLVDTATATAAAAAKTNPIPEIITVSEVDVPSEISSQETTTPKASTSISQVSNINDDNGAARKPEVVSGAETPGTPEVSLEDPHSSETQRSSSVVVSISTDFPADASKKTEVDQGVNDDSAKHIKHRRKGNADLHVDTNHDDSDEEGLLSDDSFMEELKSATLQEAKPIAVPKSPMNSLTTNNVDLGSPTEQQCRGSRVVSSPVAAGNAGSDVQALPVGRSVSGSYFDGEQPVPVMVAKKVNVSSGISKRIKALEMFSSRENATTPSPNLTPPPANVPQGSAFEKFRKRASISQPSPSPASTPDTKSVAQPSASPSPEPRTTSPPNRRDSSAGNSTRSKSNSVSVTAHINRESSTPSTNDSPLVDSPESGVRKLRRSTLTVEQDTSETPSHANSTVARRSLSISSGGNPQPDSNNVALSRSDSSGKLPQPTFERSGSHSSADANSNNSPLDSVDEGKEEKKESRRSRLMNRMSSITSNSRRGIFSAISPTSKGEDNTPPPPPSQPTAPAAKNPEPPAAAVPKRPADIHAVDIGEVNVQFPDTLLWKRRFMRIDEQGYLILTPGTADSSARNIVKRYHLSEFRQPCLPDQDMQELPNSIVLDFLDGSTLQCACESKQGQDAILQSEF